MKGTVVKCMEELVTTKFGVAKWKECLKKAGLPESKLYSTLDDVPDGEILGLMKAIGQAAGLNQDHVMSAFGEHWSTVYAPRVYKSYFDAAKSTREFLMKLDEVHVAMTRSIKMAHPPRFTYQWQGDKHLVMHYGSSRGLVALMPGLIAGLGKHYKDHPVARVSGNEVHVQFL